MDYKALLKKYASHVASCEGVDFIDYWRFRNDSNGVFTDDEIKELYLLSGRTEEEFYRDRDDWYAIDDQDF